MKLRRAFQTLLTALGVFTLVSSGNSASRQDFYYAHPTQEDEFGVIAPWHQGQNGQLDERLRLAVETYKRYPWVGFDQAVQAAPDFVYNSHWTISDEGEIGIPPTTDWMCGDLCQRVWSIVKGLTDHYQYSGDPMAFTYITLTVDYVLDYGLTSDDYEGWPRFPISNPTNGRIRGKCLESGRMQLDFCARLGEDVLTAYKLTGNPRYYDAVCHWGDLIAEHCNHDPKFPPWDRYVNPWVVGWSDKLTGSTTMICQFLDALIASGYEGKDSRIVKARDAGRSYIRDKMLPQWAKNETWGRNYWDWDNPVTCGILSMCGDYIIEAREAFPNWRNDMRNSLPLVFNRNGVDPNSMGDAYSGAWAFPESATCCSTSLSYCQYTAGPTFLRYAHYANDEWAHEIGRRMMIMATYDSELNGVVKDGIDGRQVATWEWSNLAHPWSLCQVMEAIKWEPELFAPARENHIVRTTTVVNHVLYEKGKVKFTTFDAPEKTQTLMKLSFIPKSITSENAKLSFRNDLQGNGYTVKELQGGDCMVTVRHDGLTQLTVEGDDPQQLMLCDEIKTKGEWDEMDFADSHSGKLLLAKEKGSEAIIKFTGNQIRVMGCVNQQGGWADVYLDGKKQNTLLECWSPKVRSRRVLYSRSGLENKKHELRLVVRGDRNPISGGTGIYLDSVQFSDSLNEELDFGAGSGPTEAQRLIFGYLEREDYIDPDGNSWRPATEFVIRSGYGSDSIKEALWTDRRTMWISKTDNKEIYRYGIHGKEFWTNITVAPGDYDVRLHFAATPLHWFLQADLEGGQVQYWQNVDINGERVMEDVNIAWEAGGVFTALEKEFKNIPAKNGLIEIRCTGSRDREAILQAVEIIPSK